MFGCFFCFTARLAFRHDALTTGYAFKLSLQRGAQNTLVRVARGPWQQVTSSVRSLTCLDLVLGANWRGFRGSAEGATAEMINALGGKARRADGGIKNSRGAEIGSVLTNRGIESQGGVGEQSV